jgi:protein-L-isoaspartate(D-aspartate) O-methyltransferase
MVDYAAARLNMVESQLRTNRVWDTRVLDAFERVPRERYVPQRARGFAYIDEDLALGHGRYLMEPMVMARLIQAAEIGTGDVALDLGCGTGYAAAILAQIAGTVVALEEVPEFAKAAAAALESEQITNAVVVEADLAEGYPRQAPYDIIVLGGAVAEIPRAIEEQLAEGGRMVGVVRDAQGVGRATLRRKVEGVVSGRTLFDANTPLLPGFEPKARFVF